MYSIFSKCRRVGVEVRMEEIRMNLSKRKWIIIMVCVVAIFSLTACSPSDVFNNTVAFVNEKADAYRAACDTLRE